MRILYLLFLLVVPPILNTSPAFAQSVAKLSGKITVENLTIPNVIVQLKIGSDKYHTLTDNNGGFIFENPKISGVDTAFITVRYLGYKTVTREILRSGFAVPIDIKLTETDQAQLKEVVITGSNRLNNAYKSTYKIDHRNFIKNAKANAVLETLPNLSVQNDEIFVEGNNKALILINGVQASPIELRTIDAEDVDRVEVISNPTTAMSTEHIGSLINVILKKKKGSFIKGVIDGSIGIRNNYYSTFPSLSYKRGAFLVKSYFSKIYNEQLIETELERAQSNGFYNENSERKPKGGQYSFNTRINYDLSKKTALNVVYDVGGYSFNSLTSGSYITQASNEFITFFNRSKEKQNRITLGPILTYNVNSNNTLTFKGKFFKYDNIDNYNLINELNNPRKNEIRSSTREISGEFSLDNKEVKLGDLKVDFYSGLKYINRNFDFNTGNIKQSIYSLFSEINTDFSSKVSFNLGLDIENTDNKGANIDQNYYNLLPTVNLVYHFANKQDLKFGYSKRMIRPGAYNLNDDLVYINPGLARKGNNQLKAQIRDYYSITFSKASKVSNLSLKLYNEQIKNGIIETYTQQGDILVNSMENVSRSDSYGLNVGFRTKLFRIIMANFNSGIDYNTFETDASNVLVSSNSGFTFRNSFNLRTNMLKNKLALIFSGYNTTPAYTLINKTISYPSLNLEVESNFFKDKLNARIGYRDMFALNTVRKISSNFDSFRQLINNHNKTTNIVFSLAYNFGKVFNDRMNSREIENSDIIVK
jgi:hypothetical protein